MRTDMSSQEHFHHEKDRTELEKVLNKGLTRIEPYTNQILIGFLVVTILAVGGILWYRSTGVAGAAGWKEYNDARVADDYLAVARNYPNTPVGNWAKLTAGRAFLMQGIQLSLTNREASDEDLKKAKEAFESLLSSNASAQIREEALYGLATALEASSGEDLQPAITAYETLLEEFPGSEHRPWVMERVEQLKDGKASQFYAWFREQNPKPADRPLPRDFPPQGGLNIPDLELPDFGGTATEGETAIPPVGDLPFNLSPGDLTTPDATTTPDMGEAMPAPDLDAAPAVEEPSETPDAAEVIPADPSVPPVDRTISEEDAEASETEPQPEAQN